MRGSLNRHAEVDLDGGPVFVKLYADPAGAATESAVLAVLAARHPWPIAPVAAGDDWVAFPLLDLAPAADVRGLGALLRDVHDCPPPPGIERMPRAVDDVPARLVRLRDFDAAAADRAETVWAGARAIRAAAETYRVPPRLLHNDAGLRNAVVRPDGVLALLDFERSAVGDPHWDVGKTWDAELADGAARAAFLAGYGARDWPHPETLWATRFAAAVAAIAYATKVGDDGFRDWARGLLETLAGEAG